MKSLKLLFMGTPHFALPSLEQLYRSGHKLAAVVTQPDRPRGRGKKLNPSPVKQWALENEIALYQPARLKESSFLRELETVAPDLIAVVAYGLLLPPELLKLPPLGCINLHASLLPAYRGAAPIERAVMDGARETGVTVMFMAEELDVGDIILQERQPISFTILPVSWAHGLPLPEPGCCAGRRMRLPRERPAGSPRTIPGPAMPRRCAPMRSGWIGLKMPFRFTTGSGR